MYLIALLLGAFAILFVVKTGVPQIDSILSFEFLRTKAPVTQIHTVTPAAPLPLIRSDVTESFEIRKIVWSGALKLAAEYPLFGTGLETFGYAYYQVRPVSHNLTSEWDYLYNRAHNEFLNVLATSGWIGFGAYLFYIGWLMVVITRFAFAAQSDKYKVLLYLSLLALIVSICITNFFGFSITVVNVYWYLIPAFALAASAAPASMKQPNKKTSLFHWLIALAVLVFCANYLVSYWYADYLYAQSDGAIKSGNVDAGVYLLTKALDLRYEHVYEDKLSYAMAQLAFMDAYKKQDADAKALLTKSENYNLDSIKASPQNVLYWKTRVKNQYVYYQMTLDKKYLYTGLSALQEAEKLAPTDPKIPYFASTYYTLLYDEEKNPKQQKEFETQSIKSIDKAIALKENYQDAYVLKMQLFKKYKMLTELKKLEGWYLTYVDPTNTELKKEYQQLP